MKKQKRPARQIKIRFDQANANVVSNEERKHRQEAEKERKERIRKLRELSITLKNGE